MSIAFFSATRNKITDTLYYKSITKIAEKDSNITPFFESYNKAGLSKCYNTFLEKQIDNFEYIVFCHDDITIDDYNITSKLELYHKKFDIIGLAGGINPIIRQPALWHLMCGGFSSGNLRGAVAHYIDDQALHVTSFGATPSRVTVLDGLFLSLKTASIKAAGWKFNENYTFHHYDIASSLDANKLKLRLGVAPIWAIHKSPGLMNINDAVFTQSQIKFLREYSS